MKQVDKQANKATMPSSEFFRYHLFKKAFRQICKRGLPHFIFK